MVNVSRSPFVLTSIDLAFPANSAEAKLDAPVIVRASTFAVKVRVSKSVFPEMVTSPKVPSTINVESAV